MPFLIEAPPGVEIGDPHEYLRDIRRFLQRRRSEAVLLGEVNLPFDQQLEYFGGDGGEELTLQFDFISMQALYLSLARSDPAPAHPRPRPRGPRPPPRAQWANFVRNHDELTLDKLTDAEREEVFEAFAPDERQRVYGRGITRRIPPMLGGDPRRIRMVYSLLFSLPGTPVLFYGEEIGMGENTDDRGAAVGAHAHAVEPREERRVLARAEVAARRAASPTDGYAPQHVNVDDSAAATTARCCSSSSD